MSTRSIIALQKGNRVRYCYVHSDGNLLGRRLKEMLDVEIEDLFNRLSPLDAGENLHLSHIYSGSEWEARVDMYSREHPEVPREKVMENYTAQNSAYYPLQDTKPADPSTEGSYTTESKSPDTHLEALGIHFPEYYIEYVWHYNLDTRKVTCFERDRDWKRTQSNRRCRRKPVDFTERYA
jgi:hypothetical protein